MIGRGAAKCEIFYNMYLYILMNIMRGRAATEREDFCICISLNAALLGPPQPQSVLQSLVSICYTFFFFFFFFFFWGGGHFFNFSGGIIPLNKFEGACPPPPVSSLASGF